MLKLENIKKNYQVADTTVEALKGINLCFRKNEFVSILGPSGCGKTTMLNIIGGLDKYTSGDLVINGVTTKKFKDRDWDVYRNHRVGFIFQSYNLIPHQTVLGNVELALTIAGLPKGERIARAKKALDRVGLANQYYKRPNQLSDGQCQRVAIARALVNEPEILLADEPTGALDTQTSIQIMELIKEIASEKLVIMVTHNPELAEQYSSRIVRLLDGEVIEDSNPFTAEEEALEVLAIKKQQDAELELLTPEEVEKKKKTKEKAKMSLWTAFKLSLRNLHSKLKRTIMVVIAGSIGIIGVSTVLAVSTGVTGYIDDMQDDMLSGNPITITETGFNYEAMMDSSSFSDKREALEKGDWVNVNSMVQYLLGNQDVLLNLMYQNEFDQDYVNYIKSMPSDYYSAIKLDYGINVLDSIYTNFDIASSGTGAQYNKVTSLSTIKETYTALIEEIPAYAQYASIVTSLTTPMSQCISDNDYINSQYDVLYGELPADSHDVLIVLDGQSQLTDLMLAQLGYYTQEEFLTLVQKGLNLEANIDYKNKFEYEELMNKKFTWYPNDTIFSELNMTVPGTNYVMPFAYSNIANSSWNNGIELNICGIVKPKDGISYGSLTNGFLYTEDFAREIININKDSKIAQYINENGAIGLMNEKNPTLISYMLEYYPANPVPATTDTDSIVFDYVYSDSEYKNIVLGTADQMMSMLSSMGLMGEETPSSFFNTVSLRSIGGNTLPQGIYVYPLNFENKNLVTDYLDAWNESESVTFYDYEWNDYEATDVEQKTVVFADEERAEIKYTDSVELIINMIKTMINIITYALIAFTALALVVSTVMVGIITYVSVVERVKEIGVIRSLGGRKKDVAHLFNAETFIIGLASGLFGIAFTGLLSLILNLIFKYGTDGAVTTIAELTPAAGTTMVIISVVLTLISGMLPSRSAAKKDPVNALRTE